MKWLWYFLSVLKFIQKKSPEYQEKKETTAWSMEKFNEYVNNHVAPGKRLDPDWVYFILTVRSFIELWLRQRGWDRLPEFSFLARAL